MQFYSRKFYFTILILSALFLTGCLGGKRVPNLDVIFAKSKVQSGKRPVIIIPGILGSEIVNPKTDEVVWVNLSPVKGDNLSLPISPDLKQNKDTLVARRIIEKARVFSFLPEISVYQSLIDAMQNYGGYKEGSWENPAADGDRDTFYIFAYDWRLDNVENAQKLISDIKELKKKLNEPDLRFNVIAHSMGGLIARYAAMYGSADLPPNGVKPQPTWAGARDFNKVFMFGTPNEGSMESLQSLIYGYRIPTITGKFKISSLSKETQISSPAIFQLLPHQNTVKFFDENLQPLDVDLYNPETWKKYGWSAYTSPTFRAQFADNSKQTNETKENSSEYANTPLSDLDAYFKAVLNRAEEFHEALDADTSLPPNIAFFAFGSDCESTLDAAIIRRSRKTNQWITQFNSKSFKNAAGKKIDSEEVKKALYAPGDGRVTRRSLLAETVAGQNNRNSLFRKSFPVSATFFCEEHSEIPNNKIVIDNFLTALMAEVSL